MKLRMRQRVELPVRLRVRLREKERMELPVEWRDVQQGLLRGRERVELRVQQWEERPPGASSVTYALFAAAGSGCRRPPGHPSTA
jgi:hypothetical protein